MASGNDAQRTGGFEKRGESYYARFRLPGGRRMSPRMLAVKDDAAAAARSGTIAAVATRLHAAGREYEIKRFAESIGAAENAKAVRLLVAAAERVCAQSRAPGYESTTTFEQLASLWTTGELHREHPDHVKAKSAASKKGDENILKNRINPHVGPIPVATFTLDDADRVMRELPRPPAISQAYRRAVAQVIHRVLKLAAFPCKLRPTSPIPEGWLPALPEAKARSFLYPREDAALLGNEDLDVRKRLLVGFLLREGPREGKVRKLPWSAFDLDLPGDKGTITLPPVKHGTQAKTWVLDPGVVRALRIWKRVAGGTGPFVGVDLRGDWLRDALVASKVKRAQLFEDSDGAHHFRAHDTRSTFITYALREGKSPDWIADRTDHKGWAMILRYKASARLAAELELGSLLPLDKVIPELREKSFRAPSINDLRAAGAARGHATQTAKKEKREARAKRRAA